jgi:hypothetical protein
MNQAAGEDIAQKVVIPNELKANGVNMPAQQQAIAPEFANRLTPPRGDCGHQQQAIAATNRAQSTTDNGIPHHPTADTNENDTRQHQPNGNGNIDNNDYKNSNEKAAKQAIKDLHSILDRLIQMDPNRWFQHPVQDKEAPNYYQIIKQPMCFDIMHKKIDNQQYINWTDLVKDFELICNNAMKYNQKRSRVHQRALVMLRAGKKVLMDYELEGRRALSALHPSAAAAAAAATPIAARTMLGAAAALGGSGGESLGNGSLPPSLSLHITPSIQLTGSFGGLTPRFGFNATDDDDDNNNIGDDDDMDVDYDDEKAAVVPSWDVPRHDGGYSSFEATDIDDDDDDGIGNKDKGGGGGILPSFTSALAMTRGSATVIKLPWASGTADGGGTTTNNNDDDDDVPAAHNMGLTEEWKNARRNVEWRIRWLEMRLRELQHHRNRYAEALEKKTCTNIDDGVGEGGDVQDKQVQITTTAPAPTATTTTTTTTTTTRKRRERKGVPELTLPNILKHPFFKDHSMIRNGSQHDHHPLLPPSTRSTTAAVIPADEPDFPARAHAVLDILSRQLADLRGQVESLQPSAQAGMMMMMQRGGGRHGSRFGNPGGGGVPSRRSRGYLGGGGGGGGGGGSRARGTRPTSGGRNHHHHHHMMDDGGGGRLSKRRREQYSMINDVVTPGAFAPKFVERLPVKNIDTPGVKVLPADEMEKMYAAVDKAQKDIRSGAKEASEAIDALVAELCGKKGKDEGDDEDDEATDDEAFAARHAPLEEKEKTVFASYIGGGAQRGQKNRSKNISKNGKKPRGRPSSASKGQMMAGEALGGGGQQQQQQQQQGGDGGMVRNGSVTSHQQQQQQQQEEKLAEEIVLAVAPVEKEQQVAPVANGKTDVDVATVHLSQSQKSSKRGRPKKEKT